MRNSQVYLLLPTRQPGGVETAPPERTETVARFATAEHEAMDTNAGYQGTATVPIGRLRLRFALEGEARGGHAAIGLARIVEMRADKSVVLDDGFIPPLLVSLASPVLAGFATQLQGLLHHRAEALAGRVSESATRGAAEIADYLLLQVCNRYEPLMTHLAATLGQMHPEDVLPALRSAWPASWRRSPRRASGPPAFPPYRHDDLQATFRPVMAALRQSLSAVLEQTRGADPAAGAPVRHPRRPDRRPQPAQQRDLGAGGQGADAAETLRRSFPNQVKIGPVEQIRDLVNVAAAGHRGARAAGGAAAAALLRRIHLFRAGPQQPLLGGSSTRSGGVAMHVAGDFPGLEMEFWAIRG